MNISTTEQMLSIGAGSPSTRSLAELSTQSSIQVPTELSTEELAKNGKLLATHEYPCVGQPIQVEPLVLIHGWGCDSGIWQAVLPELTQHLNVIAIDLPGFGQSDFFRFEGDFQLSLEDCLESTLNSILAVLPNNCSLLGWSLGGMLSTVLVSRYPQRFNNFITIASNPCFVQQRGWLSAMPKKTFNSFYELFKQQSALCLKRFYGLQCQSDQHERDALKFLKEIVSKEKEKGADKGHLAWSRGLELLAEIDNRDAIKSLEVCGLHLYGESDQLVPVATAQALKDLNSLQQVDVLESTSHVPQLSCPDLLVSKVLGFIKRKSYHPNERYHLDKQRVAKSFSRAAKSYDSVARLQRQVGQHLLSFLPDCILLNQMLSSQILDLGCGTGYFTELLANKYLSGKSGNPELIGADLAEGMLAFANTKCNASVTWLCGDAESLPLADNSVDLIFSNLAFQWCEKLPILAAEITRVLKPGGTLAFTSLGSKTLCELRESWAEVDDYVHVNHFMPAESWRQAFSQAGLDTQHFDVDHCQLDYRDLRHLTDELKGLGAHNVNSGQKRGLTGPEQIRALIQAYEKYRNTDGQLPATWEVIYGVATLNV